MTRDDKQYVFLGLLLGLPIVSWLCMAAWRYGINRPVARGLLRIAKLTPQDQFLMGALVIGLTVGFFVADQIGRAHV